MELLHSDDGGEKLSVKASVSAIALVEPANARNAPAQAVASFMMVPPCQKDIMLHLFRSAGLGFIDAEADRFRRDRHDQSSSARRLTAGASGFLLLSHSDDRPDSYREPRRFDTMPSKPSLHACSNTIAASCSICSLN